MKERLPFLAVLVLGVLGIAALLYFTLRSPENNENFPEGTWWVCTNKSTPHEFTLSMKELGAWHKDHYGEAVKCPTCGQAALRASKCKNCGAVSAWTRESTVCPKCKTPIAPGS
jgi:hypothetical protein